MVDILPDAMIGERGHGFIELVSLHSLNCSDYVYSAKANCRRAADCRARSNEAVFAAKCGLERFEVIGWFALIWHDLKRHHNGVLVNILMV